MSGESIPPTSQDLPALKAGDLVTPELARRIEDEQRRPWHRSKWLTTTIGQVGVLAVLAVCLVVLREAEIVRDGLMYLALLTGGGQLSQGLVDTARAKAGR